LPPFPVEAVLASDGREVGLAAISARVGAAVDADGISVEHEIAEAVGGRHGGGYISTPPGGSRALFRDAPNKANDPST
jgi:hypothetical protein